MRKMLAAAGVAALVEAGCSTGNSTECPLIADDAVALLQDFVNEIDAMSSAGDDATLDPSFITRLEDNAAVLDDRSQSAGCSADVMADLLSERSAQLSASTEAGRAMIEVILADQYFTP